MKRMGLLFLFRVPTGFYRRIEIENAMINEGLLELTTKGKPIVPYMPVVPSDTDAFRKAVSEASKDYRSMKDDYMRTVKVRVTDVHSDSEYIQKDVVQEVVKAKTVGDLHQNSITESIAKITYRHRAPAGDRLKIYPTVPIKEAIDKKIWAPGINYVPLFEKISDLLATIKDYVSDVQMRAFINDYLTYRLQATKFSPVRGTIFVPEAKADEAEKFVTALRKLNGIHITVVNIYDEATVKKDMAEFFENNLQDELNSMLEEIDVAKGIRKDKHSRIKREIAHYRSIAQTYQGMGASKQKVDAMLQQAEMRLDMATQASVITKEKKAAERAYKAEKAHGMPKAPKSSARKVDPADKLAAASPRNKTGLFG